jgi:sugar phosphate isomerase/epimerase
LGGIGDEAGRGLATQLAALRRLGWRHLELRSIDGVALADLGPDEWGRLTDELQRAEIAVPCLASRIGNWARPIDGDFAYDLDELDRLLPQCTRLRVPYVRVMSWAKGDATDRQWGDEAVRRLARLADRAGAAGVTLVHENCTGWAATDPERLARLLAAVPGLRLLFDTGNGIPYGYSAFDLLSPFVTAVVHVHVKDAVPVAGGCAYVPPGTGAAGVAACLQHLLDHGYAGVFSLEPHIGLRPHRRETAPDDVLSAGFVAAGDALATLYASLADRRPMRQGSAR